MYVVSVNVGREEPISNAKATGTSGIFKRPRSGPVQITTLGLADDTIVDVENHGGVDQAVYVYGVPDYRWWERELERDLPPGTFGENITVTDLESADLTIGDCLHIGPVTLQIAAARIPCVTLAARMGDPQFLKRFRAAERPGLYCRVLREGAVQSGDIVRFEPFDRPSITIRENFREFFAPTSDVEEIRRHLAAPIAIRDRQDKEKRLAAMLATSS